MTITLSGTTGIGFPDQSTANIDKSRAFFGTSIAENSNGLRLNTGVKITGDSISFNTHPSGMTRVTTATTTPEEIYGVFISDNHTRYRNRMLSACSFGAGFETSLDTNIVVDYSTYTTATSITADLTWPNDTDPIFAKADYLTIIVRNYGAGAALVTSIVVNGTTYTMTTISSTTEYRPNMVSYCQIPTSALGFIGGKTLTATFTKNSSSSNNLQEIYVLPGRWSLISNTRKSYGVGGSLNSAVLANDLALWFSSNAGENGTQSHTGVVNYRFTARLNTYIGSSTSGINITSTAGTLAYDAGSHTVVTGSGSNRPTYTYYSAGQLAILRLTSI